MLITKLFAYLCARLPDKGKVLVGFYAFWNGECKQ